MSNCLKKYFSFVSMKCFKTIVLHTFSLYLLVLMVLPCSDVHAAHQSNVSSAYAQTDSQHQEKHNGSEACTPFCICMGCLAGVILQPQTEFVPFNPEVFSEKVNNFYTSPRSNFYGSIWQPPQLV